MRVRCISRLQFCCVSEPRVVRREKTTAQESHAFGAIFGVVVSVVALFLLMHDKQT